MADTLGPQLCSQVLAGGKGRACPQNVGLPGETGPTPTSAHLGPQRLSRSVLPGAPPTWHPWQEGEGPGCEVAGGECARPSATAALCIQKAQAVEAAGQTAAGSACHDRGVPAAQSAHANIPTCPPHTTTQGSLSSACAHWPREEARTLSCLPPRCGWQLRRH